MVEVTITDPITAVRLSPQTGASLKLAILNPKGRIWTMVAGGGASVIYADTVSAVPLSMQHSAAIFLVSLERLCPGGMVH